MAIDRSRVPLAVAASLECADLGTESIFDILAASGAAPVRADVVERAAVANEREAALLDVGVGTALMICLSQSYDERGRGVEVSEVVYFGSRYEFCATLVHPTGRAGGD